MHDIPCICRLLREVIYIVVICCVSIRIMYADVWDAEVGTPTTRYETLVLGSYSDSVSGSSKATSKGKA